MIRVLFLRCTDTPAARASRYDFGFRRIEMANAELNEQKFEEVFGYNPLTTVSNRIKWFQRSVVVAKLRAMVREVPSLRGELDVLTGKCTNQASIPSLEESQTYLQTAVELEGRLQQAERNFQSSLELAMTYSFDISHVIEDFFPKEGEVPAK